MTNTTPWHAPLFYLAWKVILLICYRLTLGFSTNFDAGIRVMILPFSPFSFDD
jgi:hypothetical protein